MKFLFFETIPMGSNKLPNEKLKMIQYDISFQEDFRFI